MTGCTANQFVPQSETALQDSALQQALSHAQTGFVKKRAQAIAMVDDFELLKFKAQAAKRNALSNLGELLEQFEHKVIESGGQVHWAGTTDELNACVVTLCSEANAQRVIKGKSMIGEEAGLNSAMEAAGFELIESDLGEYIIQLAKEPPSHIIAPAIHKTRKQVAALFKQYHALGDRGLEAISDLVNEARSVLREAFLTADVGITGANLLVAENGSIAIVTNEGNGDLSATLPRVHIVVTSIEKVVATMEDASDILEVLARSATGQHMSAYTTFFNGPKRERDVDGPTEFHVVLLDNGRSALLDGPFEPMLNCIKCGACLNHCPVYSNVGGHAYGWVYPGPMGSVLTPLLQGLDAAEPLPNASTFCGRCEEVCPMGIPLPAMLRQLREQQHQRKLEPFTWRMGLSLYSWLSTKPRMFPYCQWLLRVALKMLPKRLWPAGRKPIQAQGNSTFMKQWSQQSDKRSQSGE
ncbi:MAG: (Fe-S)-binding protein [Pseudomonadales bacterium]|nr:(Fe-S)-binding protein [Pseudomonadales bacterium]RLU01823.1 MAG: lactate utilization protein [Ketobacter sp.]